jgi:ParB family chromosome partitioning protein
MARKDRLSQVFGADSEASPVESGTQPIGSMLPAGNVAAPTKPAPFGLNRMATEHLQKPNTRYIQEIDPVLIDNGGPVDRIADTDESADEALRASMLTTGQTTPVLLRPNPDAPGRFLVIYGRRRVRILASLGLKVKAVVRDDLSAQDLIVIQGLENSVRKDLSFLERARFLVAIEREGYGRKVAMDALAIDRARASNYAKVGATVPEEVALAIGPAPSVGRNRWVQFVEAFEAHSDPVAEITKVLNDLDRAVSSDDRFNAAFGALKARRADTAQPGVDGETEKVITLPGGNVDVPFATVKMGRINLSVTVPAKTQDQKEFKDHLASRIEQLIRDELALWRSTREQGE